METIAGNDMFPINKISSGSYSFRESMSGVMKLASVLTLIWLAFISCTHLPPSILVSRRFVSRRCILVSRR